MDPQWKQLQTSVKDALVYHVLPAAVHEADTLYSYNRKLKTHPFTLLYMTDYLFFINILQTLVMHSWSGAQ